VSVVERERSMQAGVVSGPAPTGARDVPASGACAPALAGRLVIPPELVAGVSAERKEPTPQREWGAIIAAYLYLGGLGAGAFLFAVALDWSGLGLGVPAAGWAAPGVDWAALWLLWGPLVVALGAALLILHLGRNWLLFFTACLNPRTSWLARGFLILAAFIVVGVACLALAVFAPRWVAGDPVTWRVLQALAAVLALATAAYTGLLLRSMKYIPAWRTLVLPLLFVVSALSCGAMALALGVMVHGRAAGVADLNEDIVRALSGAERVLLVLEIIVLAVYLWVLGRGRPEAARARELLVRGERRLPFWGVVVGVGLVLPLALEIAGALAPGRWWIPASAAISVLLGGFVVRQLVLAVGVKEQAPLVRVSEWRGGAALAGSAP
jgi:formate-dependent nitrite reductase membrane component NrfD